MEKYIELTKKILNGLFYYWGVNDYFEAAQDEDFVLGTAEYIEQEVEKEESFDKITKGVLKDIYRKCDENNYFEVIRDRDFVAEKAKTIESELKRMV